MAGLSSNSWEGEGSIGTCSQDGAFVIATFPSFRESNPYVNLFYSALAGLNVRARFDLQVDDSWLRQHRNEVSAVHFHWPEYIWRTRGNGLVGRLRGVLGLLRFLRLAGRLGIKRMWTVHNLEYHEGIDW